MDGLSGFPYRDKSRQRDDDLMDHLPSSISHDMAAEQFARARLDHYFHVPGCLSLDDGSVTQAEGICARSCRRGRLTPDHWLRRCSPRRAEPEPPQLAKAHLEPVRCARRQAGAGWMGAAGRSQQAHRSPRRRTHLRVALALKNRGQGPIVYVELTEEATPTARPSTCAAVACEGCLCPFQPAFTRWTGC